MQILQNRSNCMPRPPSVCSSSQLDHQIREVGLHSKSGLPVHREAVQHLTVDSGVPTEDASRNPVCSPTLDDQSKHHSPRPAHIAGHGGVLASLVPRGRLRFLVPVVGRHSMVSEDRQLVRPDHISSVGSVRGGLMGISSSPTGSSPHHQEYRSDFLHGCVQFGLRSPVIYAGSRSTQGQWLASQRLWLFNVLEMQAVINAVRDFLSHLMSRVMRLMADNVVTVAYIKNEGGARSYTLMQMTIRLLKWCDRKAIMSVPVHLPGVLNIHADFLSRVGQTLNTEWTMAMERLRPVFVQCGELQVDLFVTFANRRLVKLHRRIRTSGPSSWTPCRCPGTTGGASCLLYCHSR